MVAQVGQAIERGLLADAHDGIHHHGARRRRTARRVQNRCPLLVGHRHGTVVVITRKSARGGTVLQRVQHRITRSLDRITVHIHARSSAAVPGTRHTNPLAHSSILANSLRSLYVSV